MKQKLVVDANIIVSALLKNSKTRELLLFGDFNLVSPEFAKQEILAHSEELAKKLGTSPANIEDALQTLFQAAKIKTAELGEFRKFLKTALRHSPDKNDAPYIALALKLGCPIWSNDKALKKQEKAIVISTEELLEQQNSFD